MRGWRKWGVFLAGLACAAIAQASGSKPIEDKDAFEKQYIECIKNVLKDNCIVSLFEGHLSPEVNAADVDIVKKLNQFNATLKDVSMNNNGVYGIYLIEKSVKATIYDNRTYLVELGNSKLIGLRTVFRRNLGKWYIETVRISLDRDVISRFLELLQSNGDDL